MMRKVRNLTRCEQTNGCRRETKIEKELYLFYFFSGSAVKCVECNSHYEKWCEDIPADFNYTKHASNKYNEYL